MSQNSNPVKGTRLTSKPVIMNRIGLVQEYFKVQPWVVGVGGDEDGMHLIDSRLKLSSCWERR